LNARTAWRENLIQVAKLQKVIDRYVDLRVVPDEEVAEKYIESLHRAARHFKKYYRYSQLVELGQ